MKVLLGCGCFALLIAESVKELYDKILESVNVKRTMAPNAWLWSLIENCKSIEDVRLLFDSLHNLRKFVSPDLIALKIVFSFSPNELLYVNEFNLWMV